MEKMRKKASPFQPSTWGRSNNSSSKQFDASAAPRPSGSSNGYSTPPPSFSSSSPHPYSSKHLDPLPVVSSHDMAEEEDPCPVCLESLSFSFRLPGEKPHIVPECGHALHEACFVAVYGPPPSQNRTGGMPRKSNLGLCGVCRRPMKVGDGDSGKSNKLAALTGMGEKNAGAQMYPGRDQVGSLRATAGSRHNASTPIPYDPTEDDPLDHSGSIKSGSSDPNHYVVTPSIQVRPEFGTITRSSSATSQPLTCIVHVELASRRTGPIPGSSPQQDVYHNPSAPAPISRPEMIPEEPEPAYSPHSNGGSDRADSVSSAPYAYNATPSTLDSPFARITEDLRTRIADWKGHPMSGLGPLQMFDILSVRRDALVREFYVYLFKEALICVLEEKKKSFGRLLSSASGSTNGFGDSGSSTNKGVLRLKGRIYIRHIKRVLDTSASGELSLTIDMEDERLESFILIFKDRASLESWKANVTSLVSLFQDAMGRVYPSAGLPMHGEMEEFGIRGKAARILSVGSGDTGSTQMTDSLMGSSHRSTMSSATSSSVIHGGGHNTMGYGGSQYSRTKAQSPSSEGEYGFTNSIQSTYQPSPSPLVTPHFSTGPSNSLQPVPHTPLDLICVISVPPPQSNASTASLKVRVIKTSLEFLISSMGSRDRLSLVTFEVGVQGRVRKTPFLSLGRAQSRKRLFKFVDQLADREDEDEFLMRVGKDEKTDVVTAVNHGLDVVLQRKSKNPISGMILVSDASDSTRRAQMDLVLARAENANVPIHSFGYGKSHDPASLWLISNHTSGTYTFVSDWYDLRDCLAGCIGGMMSIGINNLKLHMRIVDNHRFRVRKVSGGPHAIVSADGRDVDVDIGELRFGERKEMLVELELDNTMEVAARRGARSGELDATDRYVQEMGLDSLTISDSSPTLVDGIMDRMIDEVPIFELDGSFFDPSASKNVSRLAHPVLCTVTIMPAKSLSRSGSANNLSTAGNPSSPISDVIIVRRRMELLTSDMITRALVLVSRKNYTQAQKILNETKRILNTVLQNVSQSLTPNLPPGAGTRSRKEMLKLSAVRTLQSILHDLQVLVEALDDNLELFQHDHRNFGAQQAMILRDQKSWSGRTPTEKLFWAADNSIELVSRSHDWVDNMPRDRI